MRELKQDWRDIFCGFRVALDIKKMFLGFLAVVLSLVLISAWLWVAEEGRLGLLAEDSCRTTVSLIADSPPTQWGFLCDKICAGLSGLTWETSLFTLVTVFLLLSIWSLFGGAISRIAAVEFAKDERIDMREGLSFAFSKFWSFFWSPLVPLIGVGIFMVCNDVGGVLGRIPYVGWLWLSLGFPLALLAGFLVTLLAIGAVFGLPLMFPTIATEGTDAFDAISRAYSYVYSRPWRYLWYCLVSCVYGAVICAFVVAFAIFMVEVTMGTVHFGMGDENFRLARILSESSLCSLRDPMTYEQNMALGVKPITAQICAYFVLVWTGLLVGGPVLGFVASFVLTAETIVYSLMRKAVDGTDMTEVYVEEDEEDFSLPATEESPAPAAAEETPDAEDTGADADAEEEAAPAKKKAKKKKKKKKTTRKKKTT